ncbi:MAG: FAD-dependent 5-carboxymethylaminomethyl-2-thiouridine(34) oxidoreductase MnmC [Ramlibacter sp.]|nr:FAD-dependent 5-carboxymethylaminomethyl-2-thiouridine(34) oxidoreductase MnmC [Ramlibacter sp.]
MQPGGDGLAAHWAGRPQWRILHTAFGSGLAFLAAWQAWREDPQRPGLLHFVALTDAPASRAGLLRAAQAQPALAPLAAQLADQGSGLQPGFHRLVFEQGRVLLTLGVGAPHALLRAQNFEADAIWLGSPQAPADADIWDLHALKALARLCRAGTRLTVPAGAPALTQGLAQCGFVAQAEASVSGTANSSPVAWQGEFRPRWQPRRRGEKTLATPGTCVVLGAGIAGATVAASLARRGWRVVVMDAADQPAGGASSLPAGLFAPHVSPDDAPLSRLTRAGCRATQQLARAWLQEGRDWQASGVLEHGARGSRELPAPAPGEDPSAREGGSSVAGAAQLAQAGLDPATPALWHANAGWLRPDRLVRALLAQPGITWRGSTEVARLAREGENWVLYDPQDRPLASTPLLVVAAGIASQRWLSGALPLQALRGQIAWQSHDTGGEPGVAPAGLPPFPLNGQGSLLPAVPLDDGLAWLAGATFERDSTDTTPRPAELAAIHERLQALCPPAAQGLAPAFAAGAVRSWAGVRATLPDRLPAVGPVNAQALPGLWTCTGMGARGLTLAPLCAELLAALLHGEPLPVAQRLARALAADRFAGRQGS